MTKRRHKSHIATGLNESLGKSLLNRSKGSKSRQSVNRQTPKKLTENVVLDSRTHESDMQEFMCNVELANANFKAEKSNFKLIENSGNSAYLLEKFENRTLDELYAEYGDLLRIPRRPKSGTYHNAEELNTTETAEFLEWRRNLAKLSEGHGVVITPFERNIEIWRQLWRVIERSHLVVQIVDARNPLLFRNVDLEKFIKEVDPKKGNLLLMNKADLLTVEQIQSWDEYFKSKGIDTIFWSTKEDIKHTASDNEEEAEDEEEAEKGEDDATKSNDDSDEEDEREDNDNDHEDEEEEEVETNDSEKEKNDESDQGENSSSDCNEKQRISHSSAVSAELEHDSGFDFMSPSDLLDEFHRRAAHAFPDVKEGFVIGMVGYPNVGKSSTINRLLGTKKTSVSATPGKTKHFQTLIIDNHITLCDCPGLVMPSFGLSNSEMILNGILPIANMRDYYSPAQLLCSRIPPHILQQRYSILLPKQLDGNREQLQAHDLLTAVAFLKGFMSTSGIPDCSRSARLIFSDVVNGSLIWCSSPPGIPQKQFDEWTFRDSQISRAYQQRKQSSKKEIGANLLEQLERRQLLLDGQKIGIGEKGLCRIDDQIDREFFTENQSKPGTAHIKGAIGQTDNGQIIKGRKKHFNKNKREKLRRVFANC